MLDEHGIIDLITKRAGPLPEGYLPIGDDVAMIPPGKPGEKVVLKCDMLVGRTDVPPGMTWKMASRKAVAMCVSDFAAKGVRPAAFMVAVGLPRGTPQRRVVQLASGLSEAIGEWGVRLVGGDTSEAGDLILDCTMVGFAEGVVRRSGAAPGQVVVTTGPFGLPSAGLKMLLDGAKAASRFKDDALASVYRPSPKLGAGLALSRHLSSAMDSSDGLAICLHTMAEASGVGIRLSSLPAAEGLEAFAERNSVSAEHLALYGGEEYEIVGTVDERDLPAAEREAGAAGCALRVIGETVPPSEVRGVEFGDGRKVERKGWVHFRSRP